MENAVKIRYRIILSGHIQNCGFRSFCWKCAQKARVTGWVSNDETDYTTVHMEVQGTREQIDKYLDMVYKGNGWSKITYMNRKVLPCLEEETKFTVLR